jgi:hypothetical protein
MSQAFYSSTQVTQVAGGVSVVAPNNPTVPPGYYMLFVLANGVPSIAKMIRLGPPSANNPVPAVTSIAPSSTTAGGPQMTLTVNGSNFLAGSTVQWNGSNRATTFVSATQLTAVIPATDTSSATTAQVTVFNPAPGGGSSNAQTFTVNAQTGPPNPSISSLSPASAVAGGPAFTLTVNGFNFVSGSTVQWNGSNRATTFVSATQLTAAISAADIQSVGTAQISVLNPGSVASASQTFTITASILTKSGTIIARVLAPTGGGNHNPEVIRDGDKPPTGTVASSRQYDTCCGSASPEDWIGYQYTSAQTFNRVVFQEGMHFVDGGWFNTLTVQVRQNGTWVNVPNLVVTPVYPNGNDGVNFTSYSLQFNSVSGDAIRIDGAPGGSGGFISVGELEVYSQ